PHTHLTEIHTPSLHDALPISKISRTVVTQSGKLRKKRKRDFKGNLKLFERWIRFKQYVLLKSRKRNGPGGGNVQAEKKFSIFGLDRKSTRLNSSHVKISYAVF